MLKFIHISHLAVIDQLEVELRPGLNILSGETGSGKSIIVDALGLLLGERASPEMMRTGEARAFVEGVFGVEGNLPLLELLAAAGIETGGEEVVIKRELTSGGRSRILIDHQAATLGLIKTIQPHLIDIHGQGDQQSLLGAEAQLAVLDAFAGAGELRRQVSDAYECVARLAGELESARQSEAERLQALDLVDYQAAEIERARLRPGEDLELEAERNLLANAERLARLCGEAYDLLYEEERSVLAQLGAAARRIGELAEVDAKFSGAAEQVAAAKYAVEDVAFFLRGYAEEIQVSPARLKEVDDRLAEIDRLRRKYGGGLDEVIEAGRRLRSRREELRGGEERERRLTEELGVALERYRREAGELGRARRRAARRFGREAMAELAEVALADSQFEVRFREPGRGPLHERLARLEPNSGGNRGNRGNWGNSRGSAGGLALGRGGAEAGEFYFSANRGEDLKPLGGVASGGELSRLMLVLKTITAPTLFPRTLIFDEIDAGIGGRVAEAVGQRLRRLAGTNQVLCVTHQAQLARHADAHYLVTKEVLRERTLTRVVELDEAGRVEELARMLGGAEVTPLAKKHARELLKARS